MTARRITILFALLAGTIFASCSRENAAVPRGQENQNRRTSQATPAKPPVAPRVDKNPVWTILTESDLSKQGYSDVFRGIWQPSEADVPRVIQEARLHLNKLKKTTSSTDERQNVEDVLASWDGYACQAIGLTKDGKRVIHLSFFCKEDISLTKKELGEDWRHYLIEVVDGGAGYWRVDYDCAAKSFSGFNTNSNPETDQDPSVGKGLY